MMSGTAGSLSLGGAPGIVCPGPMTRAALIALRNAGDLLISCPYVVDDHTQTRLVAGTQIVMRAVSSTELSERVEVNTTYDNEAWSGIYDIDRALVLELEDNRGNVAKGINGVEVANFDWGNIAYTDCLVENGSLTVTYGAVATMNRVKVISQGNLNVTGFTGTMIDVVVDRLAALNVTNANGTWRQSTWTNGQAFNATGYTGGGTAALNCTFDATPGNFAGVGALNLVQCDFENCTLSGAGAPIISIARSTLRGFTLNRTAAGGTVNIFDCISWGTPSITVSGTGALILAAQEIAGAVNVTAAGSLTMSNGSLLPTSFVNQNGAGNMNVQRTRIEGNGSAIQLDPGSNVITTIINVTITNASIIRAIGAATGQLEVEGCTLVNTSTVFKRGTSAQLRVAGSTLFASSSIDELSGNRSTTINSARLHAGASIVQTGAGAFTDTINGLDIFSSALNLACTGGGASNTFTGFTRIVGNSSFTLNGTTGGQVITNCIVETGSTLTLSNTDANLSLNQIRVGQGSTFSVVAVTGVGRTLSQMTVTEGSLATINASTAVGACSRIIVRNGGAYTLSGAAGAASRVEISQGTIAHNGGALTNVEKRLSGTLTTGLFNHASVVHASPTSQVLTAANTNRGRDLFNNTLI